MNDDHYLHVRYIVTFPHSDIMDQGDMKRDFGTSLNGLGKVNSGYKRHDSLESLELSTVGQRRDCNSVITVPQLQVCDGEDTMS